MRYKLFQEKKNKLKKTLWKKKHILSGLKIFQKLFWLDFIGLGKRKKCHHIFPPSEINAVLTFYYAPSTIQAIQFLLRSYWLLNAHVSVSYQVRSFRPVSGWWYTGVSREKPQGGGIFFRSFSSRLAKIKTPPPWAFRKFLTNNFIYAA